MTNRMIAFLLAALFALFMGACQQSRTVTAPDASKVTISGDEKKIEVQGEDGTVTVAQSGEDGKVVVEGKDGSVTMTQSGKGGKVVVEGKEGAATIKATESGGTAKVEAEGPEGESAVSVKEEDGERQEVAITNEKGEKVVVRSEGRDEGTVEVEEGKGKTTHTLSKKVSQGDFSVPFYPGAHAGQQFSQTMDMPGGKKIRNLTVTLTTGDDVEKVKSFYSGKVKNSMVTSQPGTTVIMVPVKGVGEGGLIVSITKDEGSGKTKIVINERTSK
jgi:hypothetical protein